jgi:hypothetical protein
MKQLPEDFQKKIGSEFDHWFNHGTTRKPTFVYASDGYKEVKAFLLQACEEARALGRSEGKAYVGKVKREAYQRGYEDSKREAIQTIEELEIRGDGGGDYVTDDTELMRMECIEALMESVQSPTPELVHSSNIEKPGTSTPRPTMEVDGCSCDCHCSEDHNCGTTPCESYCYNRDFCIYRDRGEEPKL